MLKITVPATELWDEARQEFVSTKKQDLQLEHSLVSISKWEAKWRKPFFSRTGRAREEFLDYVRCMTMTQNVNPYVYFAISTSQLDEIRRYIDAPMTATTVRENAGGKKSREQITSELVYYWMISLNIPMECQKWHFNRLMTLIRVCSVKNSPQKKRSKSEIMRENAALNAMRRKQWGTKG